MSALANSPCQACNTDSQALSTAEQQELLKQLSGWKISLVEGVAQLRKDYDFKNFRQALALTNSIGALAEAENHHPELTTSWGKLSVSWWTHGVQGLHHNDFIMAARCDALSQNAEGLQKG